MNLIQFLHGVLLFFFILAVLALLAGLFLRRYLDLQQQTRRVRGALDIGTVSSGIIAAVFGVLLLVWSATLRDVQLDDSQSAADFSTLRGSSYTYSGTALATEQPDKVEQPVSKDNFNPTIDGEAVVTEADELTDGIVAQNDRVMVTYNGSNLRSGPGSDYDLLGTVYYGEEFGRTGITSDGSWSRVIYQEQEVFIYSSFITVISE